MKKLFPILLLAGCTTATAPNQNLVHAEFPKAPKTQEKNLAYQPTTSDKAHMASIKKNIDAYFACNTASTKRAAKSQGDLFALAVAAEAVCLNSRNKLYQSMADAMGAAQATDRIEDMRAKMVHMNGIVISRLRSAKSEPSPSNEAPLKPRTYSI